MKAKIFSENEKVWYEQAIHGTTKVYSATITVVRKDAINRFFYGINIDDNQGVVRWNRDRLVYPCHLKPQI